jgi:hypothetical protein
VEDLNHVDATTGLFFEPEDLSVPMAAVSRVDKVALSQDGEAFLAIASVVIHLPRSLVLMICSSFSARSTTLCSTVESCQA